VAHAMEQPGSRSEVRVPRENDGPGAVRDCHGVPFIHSMRQQGVALWTTK
jgi:hypothetical protein